MFRPAFISNLLLLVIASFFSHTIHAEECAAVSKKMGATIEEQIKQSRGIESCKYRYVYKEMGVELVLFSITGACPENSEQTAGHCGSNSTIYLAGVLNGKIYAPVIASTEMGFSPNKVKKAGDEVILSGFGYAKTDPLCCPSVKENHTLKITETGFQP